jgi:hypothetical protein
MKLQSDIQRSRQQIISEHGGKQIHPDLPELLGDPIDTGL